MLFISVIPVSAEEAPSPKEEVVYGLLNLDGSVNDLYVVNIFNGGAIIDYGNYSEIRNMTTSEKFNQNGTQININTLADKFYYQGVLESKELPWDIAIDYYLDAKEISANELGGASGKLKISVSVKQNTGINETFFNNYALQIALSLNNKLCSNIKADNATVAEAGSNKQLTYTVLPGTGIDFNVTADVHDFEMDAISINGINLTLGISVDSNEFTGQISELTDAIKGLDDGAGELLDGLNQLSIGMEKYSAGMKSFNDGLQQFSDGADKLNIGASGLKYGLSELTKQNDALISGALTIQQGTFDSVNVQLGEMKLGIPVLTPENYSTILTAIPDLASVKIQLDGVVKFTQGLKGYMDGVKQIEKGASELAIGTSEFKSSSNVIAASANEIFNAGVELNSAVKKLRDGLSIYKDGTKTLKNATSGMGSDISNKVDEMLDSISGKGDKVVSFVSDKNTNVSAVQFVLKTDSIKLPEAQKIVEAKPVELTFWQKLMKLVGIL
jgi:X-X-X-Leu-X-X-Gly heptad repeat protein